MSYKNQITLIDDLPDISEIEPSNNRGLSMIPDSQKYTKYLRNNNNNNLHAGSGMNSSDHDPYRLGYHNVNEGSYIDNSPNNNVSMYQNPYLINKMSNGSSGGFAPNSQMYYEPYENITQKDTFNCRDIADHISNCIVCSQLYKNDRTIYIIVIIILTIISFLLLRRVLDF